MRWAAILCLLCLPLSAAAQTVRVQSGEHPGFTRLAILYRAMPAWHLGRVPGGYELVPDRPVSGYDLSRIYQRIPRDRIAEVEQRPDGRLFLAVSCDCHADVFEVQQGLVIDVKDGLPPPGSPFESALAPPADTVSGPSPDPAPTPPGLADAPPAATPAVAPPVALPAAAPPLRTVPLRTPFAWQDSLALDLSPPESRATRDTEPAAVPDPALERRLAEMQANLIAQISRAAGQGMVEADDARIEAALERTRPHPEPIDDRAEASHDDAPETPAPPADGPDDLPAAPEPAPPPAEVADDGSNDGNGLDALEGYENIRIETAVDRGQSGPPTRAPMTLDGARCISDAQLDVPAWGDDIAQGADMGTYRGRIVGEFDEADPESIAALVRNYLYLSFGLEARVLVGAFGAEIPDAALYLALADIMDEVAGAPKGPLSDQMLCDTRAAMWAVLAQPQLRPTDRIATAQVLATFSELPVHLRRHLGPRLVQRFLSIGDIQSANALRNALARAPGDHGENLQMIEAEIALSAGDATAGETHLEEIVRDNGPMAPDALVRLINAKIASGDPVPVGLRDNAAALAFASRGTPIGAELQRVLVRTFAHEGRIGDALSELAMPQAGLSTEVQAQLQREILSLAARSAPEAAFLKAVLPGPVPLGDGAEADAVRRLIAARLLDLGLSDAARAQMSDDPSVPTVEDRLLYARAYLLEQRPDLVIGYLAGLESSEAKTLRAQAHEQAEEYRQAAQAYAELGADEARARALWRGRNWPAATAVVDGAEREAAELASANTPTPPGAVPDPGPEAPAGADPDPAATANPDPAPDDDASPSLAASRALLDDSREARRILEDLLAASRLPES